MRVWRIARSAYPVLDGEGARRFGGRWNSPGTPVVYTAGSQSLAILETLVWMDPEDVPADLRLFGIDVPDGPTDAVRLAELEPDWRSPRHAGCQARGDAWAASLDSLALAVPSAIVPDEPNWLLKPRHPLAPGLRVVSDEPFSFDPRLL